MKRIKRDNLAIVIVIALVLLYVFYECYSVFHIELETQTASLTTVYESIDSTAIAIRDEHTVSSTGAVTVAGLNDGDKINVGGNVAMTFTTEEDASEYSKYLQTLQKLEYYEKLESQTVGQATNVESINKQINDDVDEYIRSIESGDIESINDTGDTVNDDLIRRQLLIGESVDLVNIIQDLRIQLSQYNVTSPNGYITTDVSGVFSSYADGLENYIDYNNVTQLTVDDVNLAIKKSQSTQINDDLIVGKLVTSYSWYFATVVPTESIKGFSNGDKVKVTLKDNDNSVLTFSIVSGADAEVGNDETVLVMKCSNMNADLAKIRSTDIEIRIASYEGIKVPASAVHVCDDKKGVYVLISSQVKFRQADVIYSDDDYVLLSYDADNKNGIRIYDKIITQGKDLEDGKVYT